MMRVDLPWFCWLMVGLMPLGHCAALKGEGKPDWVDVLNGTTQGRLVLGEGGGEKPEASKVWAGKLIVAPEDLSDVPEGRKSGSGSLSDPDYQSDQADRSELQNLQGSVYGFGGSKSPAVGHLLGVRPKVDCDEDAMQLKVNGGVSDFRFNLLIDRGRVPPLPLSRIPSECGIHVQATWRGLVLTVPYDGCYVAQERDAYILPLRLWGLPARMSCPLLNLAPSPPSVACYPNGMIVKTQNIAPVEDLWVKVENEWQPLLKVSSKCGYSIVSHSDGVVVNAPYKPCMEEKDGLYSLSMSGRSEFKLFCPSLVPSLPLNLSSLVSSDQSGSADTSVPTMGTSSDASPVPSQRLATWPWFGRPYPHQMHYPLTPGSTPKQPGVPYKFSQRDPQMTHVPVSPSSPQEAQQILDPQFPNTWYPANLPEPLIPAPFGEPPAPPAFPQKPKPVPATHTSTSRTSTPSKLFDDLVGSPPKIPEQPTWPPPGAVPMSVSPYPVERPGYVFAQGPRWPHQPQYTDRLPMPPPAESVEGSSILKQTGLYQARSQILPGSFYPPEYPQRPAVFPKAVPPESFEMFSIFGATDSHQAAPQMRPGSVVGQGPRWRYPSQLAQSPALDPTAVPPESFEKFSIFGATDSHQAAPQMRPGSVVGQGPRWRYPSQLPQSPALVPTAAPPESFERSSIFGSISSHQTASQMLPGSDFGQGPQWLYPPQYPQGPAVFPTAVLPESFEVSSIVGATDSHQAAPQMHPGFDFGQEPALFPAAAPSKPLEISSVLEEADSPYQTLPHVSKPLGYSGCCPSPALYSSCCPPSLSYHQHNNLHFGLAYPAFQSAATLWSTKNLTSKASSHSRHSGSAPQPVTSQATGDYGRHSGSLLLREDIQQRGRKPSESLFSSSHPHDWPVKPVVRPQTVPNSAAPSINRPWTGLKPPLFSSLHKPLRVGSPAYLSSDKPKPGSPTSIGENSLQQSARLAPSRIHPPPVPTSGQTNAESSMFPSRERSSQLNYSDLVDSFSKHFHDQSPRYFPQGNVPSAVAVPQSSATKPEPQKQDPMLLKLKQILFKQTPGSEPPIQLDARSQEQVPGGLPNVPSHDHATEDSYILHLEAVKRHWISVVPPKQAEQTKVFDSLGGLPQPGYQPHGPV